MNTTHRAKKSETKPVPLPVKPLGIPVPDALMELAKLQKIAADQQQAVDKIKTRHQVELQAPEAALKQAKEAVDQLEQAIIGQERLNVLSTGEKNKSGTFKSSDEHITIARKPVSYIYDDKEMLAAIQSHSGVGSKKAKERLVRVKVELNKSELNKAFDEQGFEWLHDHAEQAGRDITIKIAPLGDLLIKAEMEALAARAAAHGIRPLPVPANVVSELQKMVVEGYNIRKPDHILDLVNVETARWINSNKDRYGEAVEIAIAPKERTA